jgi:hypothetical protein
MVERKEIACQVLNMLCNEEKGRERKKKARKKKATQACV